MVTFIIGHVIKVMTMLITLYDTVQENKTLIYDKNLKNNKSSGCNELTIELSKFFLRDQFYYISINCILKFAPHVKKAWYVDVFLFAKRHKLQNWKNKRSSNSPCRCFIQTYVMPYYLKDNYLWLSPTRYPIRFFLTRGQ